jgi:uncharacterized protein (TIGR02001 family)
MNPTGTVQPVLDRRLGACAALLCMACATGAPRCLGADLWAGSVTLTSDYLVRGISRSDGHAALQLDLHYIDDSGIVAGLFASNTQIDPDAPRDAELNGYLGFTWTAGSDWRGKVLAGFYAYPWNAGGSQYNYGEFDLDVTYREWLEISVGYIPGTLRFLPYGVEERVQAESIEVNLQRPLLGKLSGTAGIGYYESGGPGPSGYAYWSAGIAWDLAPVTLAVSYVDANAAANSLFYNAATGGRWTGTAIWRF